MPSQLCSTMPPAKLTASTFAPKSGRKSLWRKWSHCCAKGSAGLSKPTLASSKPRLPSTKLTQGLRHGRRCPANSSSKSWFMRFEASRGTLSNHSSQTPWYGAPDIMTPRNSMVLAPWRDERSITKPEESVIPKPTPVPSEKTASFGGNGGNCLAHASKCAEPSCTANVLFGGNPMISATVAGCPRPGSCPPPYHEAMRPVLGSKRPAVDTPKKVDGSRNSSFNSGRRLRSHWA
mmetsp:Transcript_132961/g.384434  ORF Transcript_132961/g.384434 Transcript_132961/m.384434 type:complete len:234 (+) Transcript_132961:441-1142(+)